MKLNMELYLLKLRGKPFISLVNKRFLIKRTYVYDEFTPITSHERVSNFA
jgi:hypothetical protein